MRGLDTNVLVRYLTADDPVQFAAADGKGNFAGYIIGAVSLGSGCRDTVTFDKALKGAAGFTVLG